MTTLENIREKLESLIASGKSGIVALCGEPCPTGSEESFWEYHDALVFIEPLRAVMSIVDNCTSYFHVPAESVADSFFAGFAGRENSFAVAELGYSEKDYLEICTDCLLNDMAHDDTECPDYDYEDYDARFVYPSEEDAFCPYTSFTVTGAEDVESDIRNFRAIFESGGEFVFRQRDGREKKFAVSRSREEEDGILFDVYALSAMTTESLMDEETGAEVTVERRVRLRRALDWRTFYAKSRLFIFQNL